MKRFRTQEILRTTGGISDFYISEQTNEVFYSFENKIFQETTTSKIIDKIIETSKIIDKIIEIKKNQSGGVQRIIIKTNENSVLIYNSENSLVAEIKAFDCFVLEKSEFLICFAKEWSFFFKYYVFDIRNGSSRLVKTSEFVYFDRSLDCKDNFIVLDRKNKLIEFEFDISQLKLVEKRKLDLPCKKCKDFKFNEAFFVYLDETSELCVVDNSTGSIVFNEMHATNLLLRRFGNEFYFTADKSIFKLKELNDLDLLEFYFDKGDFSKVKTIAAFLGIKQVIQKYQSANKFIPRELLIILNELDNNSSVLYNYVCESFESKALLQLGLEHLYPNDSKLKLYLFYHETIQLLNDDSLLRPFCEDGKSAIIAKTKEYARDFAKHELTIVFDRFYFDRSNKVYFSDEEALNIIDCIVETYIKDLLSDLILPVLRKFYQNEEEILSWIFEKIFTLIEYTGLISMALDILEQINFDFVFHGKPKKLIMLEFKALDEILTDNNFTSDFVKSFISMSFKEQLEIIPSKGEAFLKSFEPIVSFSSKNHRIFMEFILKNNSKLSFLLECMKLYGNNISSLEEDLVCGNTELINDSNASYLNEILSVLKGTRSRTLVEGLIVITDYFNLKNNNYSLNKFSKELETNHILLLNKLCSVYKENDLVSDFGVLKKILDSRVPLSELKAVYIKSLILSKTRTKVDKAKMLLLEEKELGTVYFFYNLYLDYFNNEFSVEYLFEYSKEILLFGIKINDSSEMLQTELKFINSIEIIYKKLKNSRKLPGQIRLINDLDKRLDILTQLDGEDLNVILFNSNPDIVMDFLCNCNNFEKHSKEVIYFKLYVKILSSKSSDFQFSGKLIVQCLKMKNSIENKKDLSSFVKILYEHLKVQQEYNELHCIKGIEMCFKHRLDCPDACTGLVDLYYSRSVGTKISDDYYNVLQLLTNGLKGERNPQHLKKLLNLNVKDLYFKE